MPRLYLIALLPLLSLLAACKGAPSHVMNIPRDSHAKYFPRHSFPDDEVIDDYTNIRYSSYLFAMREPILSDDNRAVEAYRLTWLRSDTYPISVRIEKEDTTITLSWKVCDGKSGYLPGPLKVDRSRPLTQIEWQKWLTLLKGADFWNLSSQKSHLGENGIQWVLEGKSPDDYHVVDRWSPDRSTPYYQCCNYLLSLTEPDVRKEYND